LEEEEEEDKHGYNMGNTIIIEKEECMQCPVLVLVIL
jgi:hypothetical protein